MSNIDAGATHTPITISEAPPGPPGSDAVLVNCFSTVHRPVYYDIKASAYQPVYYDADFTWTHGPRRKGAACTDEKASSGGDGHGHCPMDVNGTKGAAMMGVSDPKERGYLEASARYLYPTSQRVVNSAEYLGGWFAWMFGFQKSRFQYAVDEAHRGTRLKEYKKRMESKKKAEHFLIKGMQGMDDPDDDISDIPYAPLPSVVQQQIMID